MGEFEPDVPPHVARPLAEKTWSQKFRTHKNSMRALLKKGGPTQTEPTGIDPIIWRKFVENEMDPKKIEVNKQNKQNRDNLEFSHCLGRRSYAQKEYLMLQENPSAQISRADKWLAAHEHVDGTVLERAKSKYDQVKAAANKRKSRSLGEGCTEAYEDIDNDEIAEVFGKEKKGEVYLCDKFGTKIAMGHVVTDGTSKTCHFKNVGSDEKKIYIEEVIEPNARLWDPPQGGYDTLAGFVQGGYVIWLENWLAYV